MLRIDRFVIGRNMDMPLHLELKRYTEVNVIKPVSGKEFVPQSFQDEVVQLQNEERIHLHRAVANYPDKCFIEILFVQKIVYAYRVNIRVVVPTTSLFKSLITSPGSVS